ncbi:MAG: clostripain-related cysteine peptidase [Candidatus Helarchaeota archaeon]
MNKKDIFLSTLLISVLFLQYFAPTLISLIPSSRQVPHDNVDQIIHRSSKDYKWTYIGYFCADNNLDEYGVDDVNEMEKGMDNSANVSAIVLIDREYSGAKTYKIQYGTSSSITSPIVYPTGIPSEPNMGDGSTLETFLKWVLQNYPAERYILDLWDHGGGWFGICYDDTSGQDGLSLQEVKDAISGALTATGEDKIDIISMDACLMGMIEVSYYLGGLCDVLVASEEVIYAPGYPYESVIGHLCQYANTYDSYQMAIKTVDDYESYYSSYDGCTLSAVNLSSPSYNNLTNTFEEFAQSLYDNLLGQKTQITNARSQTQEFYYPFFIDLYDLCKYLAPMGLDYISSNATAMMTAISDAVIDYAATGTSKAKGISIYFPETSGDYRSSYGSQQISIDSKWDDFLNYYYTAPDVSVDIISYITNETIQQGGTVDLTVTLKNTGTISATDVEASLHSHNPNITVWSTSKFYDYGQISVGSEKSGVFTFNVSSTIENESIFNLYFNLSTKYSGITRTIYRNISLYFIVGIDAIIGGSSFDSAISIDWGETIGMVPGPASDRSGWYKINISESINTVLLNLTSPVTNADFDMYIYTPSNILITLANSANFPDITSFTRTEVGEFRIRIYPYQGEGIFRLNLVQNQVYEDGNSMSTAFEINLPDDSTVTGSLPNSGNPNGYMYYRVVLLAGQTLVLSLTGASGTDFDIYLVDTQFNVLDRGYTAYYPERLTYTAEYSSVYYIILVAYSGSGTYSMNISIGTGFWFMDTITIILIIVIVVIVLIGLIIYWKYFT